MGGGTWEEECGVGLRGRREVGGLRERRREVGGVRGRSVVVGVTALFPSTEVACFAERS